MSQQKSSKLDPAEWLDVHGDYLFTYAMRRMHDAEGAEEVVQETFVAGLRAQEQYAGTGNERAWLLGILKRKIIDVYRARQRQTALADDSETGDPSTLLFDQRGHWRSDTRLLGAVTQDSLQSGEFWEAFKNCLSNLPPKQAAVFAMREIDDVKSEKICKELKISSSNLWVLLHRARLGLAKCLGTRWNPEGTSP